jgi:hypothetical protein
MSARLWLRAVPVIAMSLLLPPLAACARAEPGPPLWEAGSPAPVTDPTTSAGPSPTTVAPSPTTASPTPKASVTPRPSASRTTRPPAIGTARVSILRTRGSGGQDARTLTVEGDGRWSYRAGDRDDNGTLSQPQRQRLQTLLADPALADEGRSGRDWPRCRVGDGYALTTGPTMVLWQACGSGTPEVATAVVRLLEGATPL